MTFEERSLIILEESIGEKLGNVWDKTKQTVKNNPTIAGGIGGAGLGALLNYATDGSETLAADRTQDVMDFRADEAPTQIAIDQMPVDKNTYMQAGDLVQDIKNPSTWQGFKNGLYDSGNMKTQELIQMRQDNPGLSSTPDNPNMDIIKPHVSNLLPGVSPLTTIDSETLGNKDLGNLMGEKYNTELSPNQNWEKNLGNRADTIRDDQSATNRGIESNPELNKEQDRLMSKVGKAQSDSYRNKMIGGAALGAGGTYAARKAKERMG